MKQYLVNDGFGKILETTVHCLKLLMFLGKITDQEEEYDLVNHSTVQPLIQKHMLLFTETFHKTTKQQGCNEP